jgi:hypothetical protein
MELVLVYDKCVHESSNKYTCNRRDGGERLGEKIFFENELKGGYDK